jgi:HPt (histidine-containing phosphotransfer) domain-containing protein
MKDGTAAEPVELERSAVRSRLQEILGDGTVPERDLVVRLVEGFLPRAERLVADWATALADGDVGTARRLVHTLVGKSLNVGSVRLSEECRRTEAWTAQGWTAQGWTADLDGRREQLAAELRAFDALLRDVAGTLPAAQGDVRDGRCLRD